jgi:uncharacterized protein YjbI with pentapeptide repeats
MGGVHVCAEVSRIQIEGKNQSMKPITQPINSSRFTSDSDNLNTLEKGGTVEADLVNLRSRIEKNCAFLDELKKNTRFQNVLILMRKMAISNELLFSFLSGQSSLQQLLGEETWMTNLLVKTYDGLEAAWLGYSHFLSNSIVDTIQAIFRRGYLESAEKFQSKMHSLMDAIENHDNLGQLDLSGADLSYISLRSAKLAGVNLVGANLIGSYLTYADLSGANLAGADLRGTFSLCAKWSGANLAGTIFIGTFLDGVLTDVDLRGANLTNANLVRAIFYNANLAGANLTEAKCFNSSCSQTRFRNANLSGADLTNAVLESTQLRETRLIGAKSDCSYIIYLIKKQEEENKKEKYKLFKEITEKITFNGSNFPQELIHKIGCNLIEAETRIISKHG